MHHMHTWAPASQLLPMRVLAMVSWEMPDDVKISGSERNEDKARSAGSCETLPVRTVCPRKRRGAAN